MVELESDQLRGRAAAIFIATGSGLASYEGQNFVAHVVQHLLLMTFAPILLALGAPVSLALQASREPAQQRLSSLLEGGALGSSCSRSSRRSWHIYNGRLLPHARLRDVAAARVLHGFVQLLLAIRN